MSPYITADYRGEGFELFGPAHIVALAVVVLINVAMVWWRKRLAAPGPSEVIRWTLVALLVGNELVLHGWHIAFGRWNVQELLPFHLCAVLVWTCAGALALRNTTLYPFFYFLGLAGASQALLTPDAGPYGFPHLRFFQVFISHGAIVTTAVYLTFLEGKRPYFSDIKKLAVAMNVYLLFVGVVNAVLGSNYMFVARKPPIASLLDFLGPWPWYVLALEGIGLLLCLLLYLPWALRDRARGRAPSTP